VPPIVGVVASIFIVEDDQRIREALARSLSSRGHVVQTAGSAVEALAEIITTKPDAVVLDLGLPDLDGSELLRMVRAVSDVPIIIATARDEESEIVRLLDAGADDYVVKPFASEQIEARIRAVLRRRGGDAPPEEIVVGGLRVHRARREASLDGRRLDLSRKEFDLLAHLALNAGNVVTKQELLAEVWREPFGGADKTVDVHLSWLRRKLGEQGASPRYLHTVRGVGVKLVEPAADAAAGEE
jgi:DNA-binding response OmpR family regulator